MGRKFLLFQQRFKFIVFFPPLSQVTDELLEKIASRSQNIIEINISDCRSMSDTGVCVLAFKCPGLLRYTAYRCKQLSDTSIIAVASHCPLLQKVHVGNQDKLTDEGLKQVNFSIYKMVLLVLTCFLVATS